MSDPEKPTDVAALKRTAEFGTRGIQLHNIRDAYQWAQYVASSGLAPNGLDTPEKVMVAVQTGAEAGLLPAAAVRAIYVVSGAPAWKGDSALGILRASGKLEKFEKTYSGEGDELSCTVRLSRYQPDGELEVAEETFSMGDARTAGLVKDGSNWKKYPRRMVYYRALGFAARDLFSDVLQGLHLAEELDPDTRPPERTVQDIRAANPEPLEADVSTKPADPMLAGAEIQDAEVVKPTTADEALGKQDAKTGPNSLGQLDDPPVPGEEPPAPGQPAPEAEKPPASTPPEAAAPSGGEGLGPVTPLEKPAKRTLKAMREALEHVEHPTLGTTIKAWSKDQREAAWEWVWEYARWYDELYGSETAPEKIELPKLPRPSFVPEYGDKPGFKPARMHVGEAAPAPEPNVDDLGWGDDLCGVVMDASGTACGLPSDHDGDHQPA